MDFAVSIINLVKVLKEKRESIISNQIGRSGTSIGAIFARLNTLTVKQILLPSFKLHTKKQTKRDIGWSFCIRQNTLTKVSTKRSILLARVFE